MLKKDLKTGMRVKLRRGLIYIVIENVETENYGLQKFILVRNGSFTIAKNYNDSLFHTCTGNTDLDVMKIYKKPSASEIINIIQAGKLLWERDKEETRTVKHFCEKCNNVTRTAKYFCEICKKEVIATSYKYKNKAASFMLCSECNDMVEDNVDWGD